ncbi:hypothetical protein ACFQ2B_12505 [Streptomyces stramineus]|uniref:Uncharacterized protein n=1 Tax=Streptomyces stramineus TaxID=173861 RepID=A0ABP3K881_9ACTN
MTPRCAGAHGLPPVVVRRPYRWARRVLATVLARGAAARPRPRPEGPYLDAPYGRRTGGARRAGA